MLPPRSTDDVSVLAHPTALSSVAADVQPPRTTDEEPTQDQVAARVAGSAGEADLARVRNVAVYLPVGLLERLRATRRSREVTYAELLVEAAAAHLDGVQSRFRPASNPAVVGMPSRGSKRLSEPGVQVQLRLDGHQLRWLDEQAARLGAPSRTALVAALLETHLT